MSARAPEPSCPAASQDEKMISRKSALMKVLPAAAGSFVEWYEFGMYSLLTPYITSNFFAGRGGSLGTWSGFAITFLFRPLGGAFFGWLADRCGRKPAMQLTILTMFVATIAQGCLPSFTCCGDWGWLGLVLLLLLRALQGLSGGGEIATAVVYMSEVAPKESLGWCISWLSFFGDSGAAFVASLVILAFESTLSKEAMHDWGWRVVYLTSIFPGLALVFLRRNLEETIEFTSVLVEADKEEVARHAEEGSGMDASAKLAIGKLNPMEELFAHHKLAMVVGSLGIAGIGAYTYVVPLYGPLFIERFDKLPPSAVTLSRMTGSVLQMGIVNLSSRLIDTWGVGKVHMLGVFVCAVATPLPLFYWWTHVPQEQAIAAVFVGQIILSILTSLSITVYLWVVELFPVRVRVTGMGIAYNIGLSIFGGLGPVLSEVGNRVISPRGIVSAPAAYTLVFGIIILGTVAASRVLSRYGLLQLTHVRDEPY